MPRTQETLAELVKTARTALQLSQEQLAKRIGVSRGTISQIESGETLKPTTDVLFPLAAALGMPAEDLAAAAGSVPPRARGPVAYDTWEALQDLVMKDPDLTRDEKRNVIGVLKSIVMPMLQQARRRARTG